MATTEYSRGAGSVATNEAARMAALPAGATAGYIPRAWLGDARVRNVVWNLVSRAAVIGRLAPIWLLAVMGGALLLVPPIGEFPIDDDWAYAQVVQRLLTDGVYHRSVWIDTAFLAQAWWGAGVSELLGFSHTSLRIGTLILAAV